MSRELFLLFNKFACVNAVTLCQCEQHVPYRTQTMIMALNLEITVSFRVHAQMSIGQRIKGPPSSKTHCGRLFMF